MRLLLSRVVGFLRGRRLDHDMDDEVRFHLEMAVDEYVRGGLNRDDARVAALRNFGGVTQMKEAYRDQRGLHAAIIATSSSACVVRARREPREAGRVTDAAAPAASHVYARPLRASSRSAAARPLLLAAAWSVRTSIA